MSWLEYDVPHSKPPPYPPKKSITTSMSFKHDMKWIECATSVSMETIIDTAVCSEHNVCVSTALITVSGGGSLLRSWDSATGALKWEVPTDLGTSENQR